MYEFNRENIKEKNRVLKEKIAQLEIERKKIQDNFNFKIPVYILDEIIEEDEKYNVENINVLINLAKINNRISKEDAMILKNEFVFSRR